MKICSYFFYFVILFFTFNAQSYDPFNSFRWNRKNFFRNNGKIDQSPWFEWWYYKVVEPETNESFYFVYGVVNPWDEKGKKTSSRSYVGMGDFKAKNIIEEEYPVDEFDAHYEKSHVNIANNIATNKKIAGNIKDDKGKTYSWNLDIKHKWSFNSTGWATGMGLTNIEWYSAQADAVCNGKIISNKKTITLKNAPCYQDRNWGHSFPEWWTWIVSNNFEGHPETALSIGGGKPKFFKKIEPIESVGVGFKHKGKEYIFRPNDLDKISIDIKFGKWEVTAKNLSYKVVVSAYAPKEKFMDLQFMTPDGKIFHDYETLTGDVTVKLYKRHGLFKNKYKLLDTVVSHHAGIEYGSDDEKGIKSLFSESTNLYSNY